MLDRLRLTGAVSAPVRRRRRNRLVDLVIRFNRRHPGLIELLLVLALASGGNALFWHWWKA